MKRFSLILLLAGTIVFTATAYADTLTWSGWSSQTYSAGVYTVTGNMTINSQNVTVTYTSTDLNFTNLNGAGTNYYLCGASSCPVYSWTNGTDTINAPPNSDIVAIDGYNVQHTITFSTPVVDPVMALVSLGQTNPCCQTQYTFNSAFSILTSGGGWWGGGSLSQSGDTVIGVEGDGLLEFNGTFSSISWTGANPEGWNGFRFGAFNTAPIAPTVPEPASLVLFGSGLAGLAEIVRRKRSK